jgi:tRNA G37 N-methylase Trm5
LYFPLLDLNCFALMLLILFPPTPPQAVRVVAVELNSAAVACAKRAVDMLRGKKGGRQKQNKNPGAADKIELVEGDVAQVLTQYPSASFDRILAPRPKGVEPGVNGGGGDGGAEYLRLLLPLLRSGAEVHWYDFAGKQELPDCERTRAFVSEHCAAMGLSCEILYCGLAGKRSIAAGQYRICIDFRVHPLTDEAKERHGGSIVHEKMLASLSKLQVDHNNAQQKAD